jgi:large subunit ribosomal protein L3
MGFILGKKISMKQIFRDTDEVAPATVVQAGPCLITQIKTQDKHGYTAVQIGYGQRKKISKSLKGQLKKLKTKPKWLKEFRVSQDDIKRFKIGNTIDVSVFSVGDKVQITGISKGKGFQGVVRRHGFHGSPASHGHKDQLRMPGSIGATAPARVFKGKKMAGRMGAEQITVKNLEIIEINKDKNLITLKGAVPGARNSLVRIKSL